MAKNDELELDTAKSSGGGKGKLIIIIVAAMLLTTGIVIGVLYFTGALGGGGGKDKADSGKKEEAKALEVKPAFYLDLQPAFVVNFEDQTNAAYLQIEMQLMARDKSVLDAVTKHMPVIRNNILLILSAQKYEVVKSRQGKEALQKTLLESVQQIVSEAAHDTQAEGDKQEGDHAKPMNVEQVYFTSFIMQ